MPLQKTGQVACHIQVREVARALWGEMYEVLMGDNRFWETWQKQNPGASRKEMEQRFIDKNWPHCIGEARKALTLILTNPDSTEQMKEQVMDVLEKDQSLRGMGGGATTIATIGPTVH